jgi:hypothetical protein
MSHYIKTIIYSDSFLKEELAKIAKDYLDSDKNDEKVIERVNQYLTLFVEKLKASLPPPDTSMLNSQSQNFEDYTTALDKWLDAWCGAENLAGTEFEGNADAVKALIRNYLVRIWMRKNDIDKDLLDILDTDNISESIVNMSSDNINVTERMVRFYKRYKSRLDTLVKNEDVAPTDGMDNTDGGFGDTTDGGYQWYYRTERDTHSAQQFIVYIHRPKQGEYRR